VANSGFGAAIAVTNLNTTQMFYNTFPEWRTQIPILRSAMVRLPSPSLIADWNFAWAIRERVIETTASCLGSSLQSPRRSRIRTVLSATSEFSTRKVLAAVGREENRAAPTEPALLRKNDER